MPPGQPYLLTRGPLPEPGFVYVTIPAGAGRRVPGAAAAAGAGAPSHHPGGPHQVSHDAGGGAGVGGLGHGRKVGVPMNDLLKQRIGRLLDSLSDERGYQILDYIEFLDSKYAERSRPDGILAKITETVEDTMRAGKLPIQAISGTMGIMDSAAKVMKGLAAAGQAVVDEAVKAAESAPSRYPSAAAAAPELTRASPSESRHARSLSQPPQSPRPEHAMAAPPKLPPAHVRAPGVHPRHRPARRHLAGRRLDDRVGHLHRLGGHRPAGSPVGAGRAAPGLDHHRRHDGHRRAGLRRAGGHDAAGGRTVRVPAGGTLAARRVSSTAGPCSP